MFALLIGLAMARAGVAHAADTTPPRVYGPSPVVEYFSPNGDGSTDRAEVTVRVNETARITAAVVNGSGQTVAWLARGRLVAAGGTKLAWAGRTSSGPRPNGRYAIKVWVRDRAGNKAARWPASGTLVLDTDPPWVASRGVSPDPFSPNGDRRKDGAVMTSVGDEYLTGTLTVLKSGTAIYSLTRSGTKTLKITWMGRSGAGKRQPDGDYSFVMRTRDRAGNSGPVLRETVKLDCTPPSVTMSLNVAKFTPDATVGPASVRANVDLQDTAKIARRVIGPTGRSLQSWTRDAAPPGSYDVTWTGKYDADNNGSVETSYPTGLYHVVSVAEDAAGNRRAVTRNVRIDGHILIVLDPGHGGLTDGAYDTGAVGYKLYESYANLTIANGRREGTRTVQKGVANYLREMTVGGRRVHVRLTRTKEKEPNLTLSRRSVIANYYGPTVFVSIHNNDASNRAAHGTETLYETSSERSRYLAQRIQTCVGYRIRTSGLNPTWVSRGLKDGDWLYLAKHTIPPMALLEGGFVNNPIENRLLRRDAYKQVIARGVADGIRDYIEYAQTKGWLWW
jgi:N-acetylmuramoyl-L-alanine amidase